MSVFQAGKVVVSGNVLINPALETKCLRFDGQWVVAVVVGRDKRHLPKKLGLEVAWAQIEVLVAAVKTVFQHVLEKDIPTRRR